MPCTPGRDRPFSGRNDWSIIFLNLGDPFLCVWSVEIYIYIYLSIYIKGPLLGNHWRIRKRGQATPSEFPCDTEDRKILLCNFPIYIIYMYVYIYIIRIISILVKIWEIMLCDGHLICVYLHYRPPKLRFLHHLSGLPSFSCQQPSSDLRNHWWQWGGTTSIGGDPYSRSVSHGP
jgi:hypothetical protein